MELVKVRLLDLEEFIDTEFYAKLNIKPISPKRAASYIHNPDGNPDDVVLYYILDKGKLIAFRTIFAGSLYEKGERIKFGWLSGNWVDAGYRGKGLAQMTLKEAMTDWNNKLMFTNYSMMGLKSNSKSKYFKNIYIHKGIRAYFSFSTLQRFGDKKIMIPLLCIMDLLISLLSKLYGSFYSAKLPKEYTFGIETFPDHECLEIAEDHKKEFVFRRGGKELNWIFSYPWMTDNEKDKIDAYPFSSYAKQFYYRTVKIFRNKQLIGFFIISVRDKHLKTLYIYMFEKDYQIIAKWIKNYVITNKLSTVTIFNQVLASQFKDKKYPFLYIKEFRTCIYSTFDCSEISESTVQDGDGDYIFT
jgi:GNAT superfamily N-acetyltransferase